MAVRSKSFWQTLPLLPLIAILHSCIRGEENAGQFPETKISIDEINLSGDDRLNSTVSLSWFGTDPDGIVEGYEISFDNSLWDYTEKQDSTFTFSLPPGSDTADIDFYVRAVDNDDNRDPTPDFLRIPLKNTPPTTSFNKERGPKDTALSVATFFWNANDIDGANTIQSIEIKANKGNWTPINRDQSLISIKLDTSAQSGSSQASIFYGTQDEAEPITLDGLLPNDTNKIFIRATDIAGAVSEMDTSDTFFLRNKTPGARTLWISGHTPSITNDYRTILDNIGLKYDLLDYGAATDGSNLPAYWDPTLKLISRNYDVIFLNTESTTYQNDITGDITTILNYVAPIIQEFTTNGGKYLVTTKLEKEEDISRLIGPYPLDSLVVSGGNSQARIVPDSALVPLDNNPGLTEVSPEFLQRDIVPIVPSSDAQAYYRAQLTKLNGWRGSDIIASARKPGNVLTQVFFAQELHNFDKDPQALEQLFEEILINEF